MSPAEKHLKNTVLFILLMMVGLLLPGTGAQAQDPEALEVAADAARGGQSRAFQRLLRETYLGHAAELPAQSEPVQVLLRYLEVQKHNFTADRKALDKEVVNWRRFTRQYPDSRYAYLGLGRMYRERAAFSGPEDLRRAAEAYSRASQVGMGQKRLMFTRQLSELMVELNDVEGLDKAFAPLLGASRKTAAEFRQSERYGVLIDYADGLAALGDDRAWALFEEAIASQPGNIEGINRYAARLLAAGKAQEALTVLEARLTRDQRLRFVRPAFLRRQALVLLGQDTSSADQEVAELRERFGKAGLYFPEKDTGNPLGNVSERFAHSTSSDDCRSATYAQQQHCDSNGFCLYSFLVNLAEIMYNEARGEAAGVWDAVGWTVRNRALQRVSCDAYVGGITYTTCRSTVPCGDPSRCALSRSYCCVMHGATTTVGASHSQFNDAHVTLSTLISSSQFYEAYYLYIGALPDPTTGFIAPGMSSCTVACDYSNYCSSGVNYDSPSPNGPMEYLGYNYCAQASQCKTYKGNVCGSNPRATSCTSGGTGDNYFWNRLN